MPWPLTVADSDAIHSVGLSRLGRSVWATATWSPTEDGDTLFFAAVWNPVSATILHLPLSTRVGVGSRVKSWEDLALLNLAELARSGRIRLTRRAEASEHTSGGVESTARRLQARAQRVAQQYPAYPLLRSVVAAAYTSAVKHLSRVVQQATTHAAASLSTSFSHSLLFTGDGPSHRHLQRLLELGTPSLLSVGGGSVVAFEKRRLNFAEVLTLNTHEALEAVEVALRAPPLSLASTAASSPPTTVLFPCLLIMMEGLHLLESGANTMVGGVVHQLCMCLEALQGGPVPAVIWSFAQDTSRIPVALLSRVGLRHVRVATTAPEDRAAYLRHRLNTAAERASSSSSTGAPSSLAWATDAVVEETAHWTVDRLVRLRDDELNALYTAHAPSSTTASGITAAVSPSPAAAEPLHAVYAHLYGVDDEIRRVEELVVWPLTHLPLLQALSIPCTKGVLLCGPSGSGKTALLACLVRRLQLPDTRGIHVLSVDGLALIEKEVGRSEKNIAQLFETARALAPTALFIDNLDALAPPRGRTTSETNTTGDRTLSTLLTQMDGVGGQAGRVVVVVASAPSLDALDAAVCRPGRLDVHVRLQSPPMADSAAFVKKRLRDFAQQLCLRRGIEVEDGSANDVAASRINALVDDFFSAARQDKGGAADLMSPAEVSALVREVVLHVAEHVELDTAGGGTGVSMEDVLRCMSESFARHGTA